MSTTVEAPPGPENEFTARRHVYEPHKVGLPPIGPYMRELWRRREFAVELSRTNLRAQHFDTAFGQLWLILNPILLGFVYFLLVDILHHHKNANQFFAHLLSGLFLYYFLQQSLTQGVKSVVTGGKLILNSAFPRALLPLASVRTAFLRFLPTMLIYIPVHIITGRPVTWQLLWVPVIILVLVFLATGLTMILAAGQVYFRDLDNFLPYVLRIWLYTTPILYYAREVPDRYQWVLDANPIGKLFTAWSDVLIEGIAPTYRGIALGAAWGVGLFIVGFLFFMSREREFAVRI
ncbi:MAG TPA: ABC transporter permease [Solirubrobacteraceae bacterium]|jgi:ABC-type polysaccharide/polyol phosphate export permease|nr:ABC transporter permease [Solirubrobacteraceae bacterium]